MRRPFVAGAALIGTALFSRKPGRLGGPALRFASLITLALVRRMPLLCWSAVGIVFVLMRSIRRSAAPAAVAISSARP